MARALAYLHKAFLVTTAAYYKGYQKGFWGGFVGLRGFRVFAG